MLRNLFALVGFVVVSVKAAEWYVDYTELKEEKKTWDARGSRPSET